VLLLCVNQPKSQLGKQLSKRLLCHALPFLQESIELQSVIPIDKAKPQTYHGL
jgi:hypothetical protein